MYKVAEFAANLKDFKQEIVGGKVTTCVDHLVKLAIFDSPKNQNHWRQEVYAAFHNIPLLKKTKKYPNPDWMLKFIWDWYGDNLESFISCAIREEPEEKLKLNDTTILDCVTSSVYNYFSWLVEQLCKKGEVTSTEVYAKLDRLGL